MDAVAHVQAALLFGTPVYDELLEDVLVYRPYEAVALRALLAPLLVQYALVHSQEVQFMPLRLLCAMTPDLSLSGMLQVTGINAPMFANPTLRLVLLYELGHKVPTALPIYDPLYIVAFTLLADLNLDSASLDAINTLAAAAPHHAVRFAPWDVLFNGPNVLRARLATLNLILVKKQMFPPERLAYLRWLSEELEEPKQFDVMFDALQINYNSELALYYVDQPMLRPYLDEAVRELARRFSTNRTRYATAIEAVLSHFARNISERFLELHDEFDLVTTARPNLIAQLPPSYLIDYHPKVIDRLRVNESTILGVANIAQNPIGLELLRCTQRGLLGLPAKMLLMFVASATKTRKGVHIMRVKFPRVFREALRTPVTIKTQRLLLRIRENLLLWGDPAVRAPMARTTTPRRTATCRTRSRTVTPRATTPRANTPRANTPRATTPRANTSHANTPRATTPRTDTPTNTPANTSSANTPGANTRVNTSR